MTKVALLIDGDNVSADHAETVISYARKLGEVVFRRIYGNRQSYGKWAKYPFLLFVDAGDGKNGADILLAIDAVQFAFDVKLDHFVIVSSDGDFSHLAHRLRERGSIVHGMGNSNTAEKFAQACSRFERLLNAEDDRNLKIRYAISSLSADGSGANMVELNNAMRSRLGIKTSELPEKRWQKYFEERDTMFKVTGEGQAKCARSLPQGFAALKP